MVNHTFSAAKEVVFTKTSFPASDYNQQTFDNLWAVIPQQDGSVAVLLDSTGGMLPPTTLAALGQLMVNINGAIKITSRQQLLLLISPSSLSEVLAELKKLGCQISRLHKGLRNIKVCANTLCKNSAFLDNHQIAQDINKEFKDVVLPWDFKISFAGCSRNCSATAGNCLGFISTDKGYTITLGGTQSGVQPLLAQTLVHNFPADRVFQLVKALLQGYIFYTGKYCEKFPNARRIRMYHLVKEFGINVFLDLITDLLPPQSKSESLNNTSQQLANCDKCGFSRESAFNAFIATDKACTHCQPCCKSKCQLYIAKTLLTDMSSSTNKLNTQLPPDFLDVIRALPVVDRGISLYQLQTAYNAALTSCDKCHITDHNAFCSVNLTLTALGSLIYGPNYKTEMDQELENLKEKKSD